MSGEILGTATPEFKAWPKITRWSREWVITEKIDGTNACVIVTPDNRVHAQSRNRLITPEDDNYGFAKWVKEHEEDLRLLGFGYHYGEWWGQGIQRGYGLTEKRFSIFNVTHRLLQKPGLPFGAVPVLAEVKDHQFVEGTIHGVIADLAMNGSAAAPGFKDPEGIIIYHVPSRTMFKKTLKDDEKPKGTQ